MECVALPPSQIFDLILSLPLLGDLTVVNDYHMPIKNDDGFGGLPTVIQPSNPPMFIGSLELTMVG